MSAIKQKLWEWDIKYRIAVRYKTNIWCPLWILLVPILQKRDINDVEVWMKKFISIATA